VDTQGPEAVDPADQWVLDPVTGEYQLRTDPLPPPAARDAGVAGDPRGYGPVAAPDPAQGTGFPGPQPGAAVTGPPAAVSSSAAAPFAAVPPPAAAPPPSARAARSAAARSAAARSGAARSGAGQHGGRRAAGRSSRRKPKARAAGGRRAVMWSAGVLGLVLVAGGVGVAVAQRHSGGGGSVHTIDVGDLAAATLSTSGPMNVLLIDSAGHGGGSGAAPAEEASGSAEEAAGSGRDAAGRADFAVLLHLSADRRSATAVTIPGNLVTPIPDCPGAPGHGGTAGVVPGTPVKGASPTFAQSLGTGGRSPGCTMLVVDRLTGLKADHFVLADTDAIQALTGAAGGVPVCLTSPLTDPAASLDLAAGQRRLTAAQAPGFLAASAAAPGRTGADSAAYGARLRQAFLGALLRQSRAGGAAVSAAVASAAARTLTVDPALGRAGALATLAAELGKTDPAHITFAAVPVTAGAGGSAGGGDAAAGGAAASGAKSAVTLDQAAAKQLFSLVARDIPLSGAKGAPDPKLTGPKATPHNTRVTVLNGSGIFGASQDVLLWLQNDKGVNRSANGGDAPAPLATTRLDYAPNQADQARSLAAMMGLPASALHEGTKNVPALTYMTLTLGKDYTAPGTPIAPPTAPPKGLVTTTADDAACVG
jgi:LCP family protein required for cell wall assembly